MKMKLLAFGIVGILSVSYFFNQYYKNKELTKSDKCYGFFEYKDNYGVVFNSRLKKHQLDSLKGVVWEKKHIVLEYVNTSFDKNGYLTFLHLNVKKAGVYSFSGSSSFREDTFNVYDDCELGAIFYAQENGASGVRSGGKKELFDIFNGKKD